MIRILFLTGVFLFFTSAAIGEYYQYTDDSGVIRFTDDMTQIPESRRESAQSFVSETSDGAEKSVTPSYENPESGSGPADERVPDKYTAPAGETFETRATELNAIQAELNKTRQNLKKERLALEAQAPAEDAANKEKIDYRMKVDALNAKIEKYGRDLKAFEEKVDAFNNRGRSGVPE